MCQHSIRATDLLDSQQGSRLSTVSVPTQNAFVPLSGVAWWSWPRSEPRIGVTQRGLRRATGEIKNTELIKIQSAADCWVDLRWRRGRLTHAISSTCAKNLTASRSCSSPSALMWATYRRADSTCYRRANSALIGAGQDYNNHFHFLSLFSVSQAELIQLPFTRLESHTAMGYPLISIWCEFHHTVTRPHWNLCLRVLRALKGRFTLFQITFKTTLMCPFVQGTVIIHS